MHDTALKTAQRFFSTYLSSEKPWSIVEIGSQDVNGSIRDVAPQGSIYTGLDFVHGKGVDVVITDPYQMPLGDNTVEVCVCSSCFEHSEFFWLLFNDIQRFLKPGGLLYLNVPSNGPFHRYPVDCYRFYPDSGIALQNWARRSGYDTLLLESFIKHREADVWDDFVAVFVKGAEFSTRYPNRIMDVDRSYSNGYSFPDKTFRNFKDRFNDRLITVF